MKYSPPVELFPFFLTDFFRSLMERFRRNAIIRQINAIRKVQNPFLTLSIVGTDKFSQYISPGSAALSIKILLPSQYL